MSLKLFSISVLITCCMLIDVHKTYGFLLYTKHSACCMLIDVHKTYGFLLYTKH